MQLTYCILFLCLFISWILILMALTQNFQISFRKRPASSVANYSFFVEKADKKLEISSKKYHIPKIMLELYERNKIKNQNFTNPDIIRSLVPKHTESFTDNNLIEQFFDNHYLIFHLPATEKGEKLIEAELRILTLVDKDLEAFNKAKKQLEILIFDDETEKFYTFAKIYVYHLNNTWTSFNLTKPVTKILTENGENRLKIVISVRSFWPFSKNTGRLKLSLMPAADNIEHEYPILLLSYTSSNQLYKPKNIKNSLRKKRSIEDYEEETNRIWDDDLSTKNSLKKLKKPRNSCRRKPLYINFSEINFDLWIVQPPGYEAYQCQGRCFYPMADHLNPTKHAIFQALLHGVSPSKASRSCCVPTILDSISILYIDKNGVLTYRYAYKDMVVTECGCR